MTARRGELDSRRRWEGEVQGTTTGATGEWRRRGTERSTTARACMATRKKALLAAHRVATAAHRNHRLPDGAVLILVLVAAAA